MVGHRGPHDKYLPEERRRKIAELYYKWGVERELIAERFGVTDKTVYHILQEHKGVDSKCR